MVGEGGTNRIFGEDDYLIIIIHVRGSERLPLFCGYNYTFLLTKSMWHDILNTEHMFAVGGVVFIIGGAYECICCRL